MGRERVLGVSLALVYCTQCIPRFGFVSDSNKLTWTKKVFTHVDEPALVYDNFIRITTYTGIFRAFQVKINI